MFRSIVLRKYLTNSSKVISDHGKLSTFEIGQLHVTTRSDRRKEDDLQQDHNASIARLKRQLELLEKKKQLMIRMSQMLTDQERALQEKLKGYNESENKEPDNKPKSTKTK